MIKRIINSIHYDRKQNSCLDYNSNIHKYKLQYNHFMFVYFEDVL